MSQAKIKSRERDRKRAIYFKMGYSRFWSKEPVHKIIKEERAKFPSLSWLRTSMCFRRHRNLREILQGDLTQKITANVVSLDFPNKPCNCPKGTKCVYNGKCNQQIVVYCANCTTTGMKYIGNTQQKVKTRMQGHKQETKELFIKGRRSDSFAAHFAQLIPPGTETKDVKNHFKYTVDILWQGNPLSCVKTFGTSACKLCAKERLAILKLTRSTPHLAINRCTEIYGACRHQTKFHRFDIKKEENNMVSTDEAKNAERVPGPRSTTPSPASSQSSTNNNPTTLSLTEATWRSLNPNSDEPPIVDFSDIRISPLEHHEQGLLARSRITRSMKSIAPPTHAWVRNAVGEPAGDFLMAEEATEGEFDEIESEPTWI